MLEVFRLFSSITNQSRQKLTVGVTRNAASLCAILSCGRPHAIKLPLPPCPHLSQPHMCCVPWMELWISWVCRPRPAQISTDSWFSQWTWFSRPEDVFLVLPSDDFAPSVTQYISAVITITTQLTIRNTAKKVTCVASSKQWQKNE